MNRGNQNFIPPENRRSRQDYGSHPVGRQSNWNNLQTISPLLEAGGPLNPRDVLLEPWRLFQERDTGAPVAIASFPGQRYYPNQIINADNDAARNAYQRQRRSLPEPSPTFQGRWTVQTPEEESRLTPDEQHQALNKLKKEVYFPIPKRGKRPNLYFREYSKNTISENGKENYDDDGKRCAICLDDFEPREVVTVTPCKHMFHEDCIIPWVKSHGQCPVCRFAICERFRENAALSNNLMADEPFEVGLISIIRAMEEALLS